MASIYRDKKTGFYHLDIRINGVRRRPSLETKDRQVARLRAKIKERDLIGISPRGPIKVEDFKEEYLAWSGSIKAPNTTEGERVALERLAAELPAGVRRIDQISIKIADDVIAAIAVAKTAISGIKTSPSRVNFYVRTLRSIFATALKWGYLAENPFSFVKKLRVDLSPPRVLSSKEIKAILAATRLYAPEYLDLWNFYLFTGFRRTEALELAWEDVDFDRGFVMARYTKGRKYRMVPMLGPVRRMLEARRHLSRPFDFSERTVSEKFIWLAGKANVPNASVQDMRRAFASYCTEMGIPPAWVQKWLGHASWSTSDSYYVGISDEMMSKLKKLEGMFSEN